MGKPNDNDIAALMDADISSHGELHWDDARLAALTHAYYADADALYLREEPPQPADNLHVGRYAVLRLDPETDEVLGAHIEGWERFFLPSHPEFREDWERIVKPCLAGERTASAKERARFNLALLHRILAWRNESVAAAPARS